MPCQLDHVAGVLARMQVGAADAAGQCLDQHLPSSGYGLRHGVDDDLAVSKNRSAHGLIPPVSGDPPLAAMKASA